MTVCFSLQKKYTRRRDSLRFSFFPNMKPPEWVKTCSAAYGFPQQKANLAKVVLPDAKCFKASQLEDDWLSNYYVVLHITFLLWLKIKLAMMGRDPWDRHPLEVSSAISTWLFHHIDSSVPDQATSSPVLFPLSVTLAYAWLVSSSLEIRRACYGSSCFSRAVLCAVQCGGRLPRWGTPCSWLRWSPCEKALGKWSKLCFLAECFSLTLWPAQPAALLPDVHVAEYQGAGGRRAIWIQPSSFPGWNQGSWNKGWQCLD